MFSGDSGLLECGESSGGEFLKHLTVLKSRGDFLDAESSES